MVHVNDLGNNSYLYLLSRGGLLVPSQILPDFVCSSFAILDYIEKDISSTTFPLRKSATYVLRKYGSKCEFTCEDNQDWGFTRNKNYNKLVTHGLLWLSSIYICFIYILTY